MQGRTLIYMFSLLLSLVITSSCRGPVEDPPDTLYSREDTKTDTTDTYRTNDSEEHDSQIQDSEESEETGETDIITDTDRTENNDSEEDTNIETPETEETIEDSEDSEDSEEEFFDIDPDAPYSHLEEQRDQELGNSLHELTVLNHNPAGYSEARDYMYAIGGIDDHNGRIECIYSGRTVDTNSSRTPGNNCELADGTQTGCSFNTEHTWAKYFLRLYLTDGSPEYNAAEGDIHHLYPSDAQINSARWHFDFGETECRSQNNCKIDELSILGLRPGSTGDPSCPTGNLELDGECVMWVRPERRGDIARAQFYMAIRYDMPIEDAMEEILREWNREDPPDNREQERNDGIEEVQGNRNPFIDRPDFVDRISAY